MPGLHVAAYVEALGHGFAKPSVKQHLAAMRALFDWLAAGGVLAANLAAPVRGPRHVVACGRTPVLTPDQARRLLEAIDVATVVGLRDRALVALMTYTFARVSAAVAMRVEDYHPEGKRWWVRLHEKGGKHHAMPAHHNLEVWMDAYLDAAGIACEKKSPLFRSARGRTGRLTGERLTRVDAWRTVRRRAQGTGLDVAVCCHIFRATGITAYLGNGGKLEGATDGGARQSAHHQALRPHRRPDHPRRGRADRDMSLGIAGRKNSSSTVPLKRSTKPFVRGGRTRVFLCSMSLSAR